MKKFSFKALGATLLTAGLVFAGIAGTVAPAQAAGTGTLSWTSGSAPVVTSSTNSLPALGLTFVPSTANATSPIEYINISVLNSQGNAAGMASIPGSSSTAMGCKMTTAGLGAISGAHITHNTFNCQALIGEISRFYVGVGSYGGFALNLDAGLVGFLTPGTYSIKVTTEYPNSPILDEAVIPFVIPQAPSVSANPSSVSATAGTAFTQSVVYTPSNFSGPYSYSTNNAYGITVNPSTGALSGTPTMSTPGPTSVTVTVTGANNATVFATFMFTIASGSGNAPPPSGGLGGSGNNGSVNVSLGLGCLNDVSIVPSGSPLSGGFWAFDTSAPAGTYPAGLSVTRAGRLQGTLSSALVYSGSAKTIPVMYFPNGTTNLVLNNKVGQSIVSATNGSGCTGVTPSRTAPSVTLGLSLSRGSRVAQAPAPVTATGLLANAPYTVEVHSTPVIIASGNVASDGSVNYTAAIPSGLEAGWHTMIFTSTAADGTSFTSTYYFKVAGDGTLLSTSDTQPAELAYTGINSTNMTMFLLGGLSLALVGAEMIMIARRKRSN